MEKTKKEPVYLRQRQRANGLIALFLDICRDGRRYNEYLKLYFVLLVSSFIVKADISLRLILSV